MNDNKEIKRYFKTSTFKNSKITKIENENINEINNNFINDIHYNFILLDKKNTINSMRSIQNPKII
jgi:hypothetical protein